MEAADPASPASPTWESLSDPCHRGTRLRLQRGIQWTAFVRSDAEEIAVRMWETMRRFLKCK